MRGRLLLFLVGLLFLSCQTATNGQYIAFRCKEKIRLLDIGQGLIATISPPLPLYGEENQYDWSGFKWSPDGKRFAFSTSNFYPAAPGFYVYDLNVRNLREINSWEVNDRQGHFFYYPSSNFQWSPDNRSIWLVFNKEDYRTGGLLGRDLFKIDVFSSKKEKIAENIEGIVFHPAGNAFLFAEPVDDTSFALVLWQNSQKKTLGRVSKNDVGFEGEWIDEDRVLLVGRHQGPFVRILDIRAKKSQTISKEVSLLTRCATSQHFVAYLAGRLDQLVVKGLDGQINQVIAAPKRIPLDTPDERFDFGRFVFNPCGEKLAYEIIHYPGKELFICLIENTKSSLVKKDFLLAASLVGWLDNENLLVFFAEGDLEPGDSHFISYNTRTEGKRILFSWRPEGWPYDFSVSSVLFAHPVVQPK